jgi:hypothetical protein
VRARPGQPASSQVAGDETIQPPRRSTFCSTSFASASSDAVTPLSTATSPALVSLRPILTYEDPFKTCSTSSIKLKDGITEIVNGDDGIIDLTQDDETTREVSNSNSYEQRYVGQRNEMTVKGVYFLGNNSEYVVTGCDTGHLFIFNTRSAKIEAMVLADSRGAVNCVAVHPHGLPIILTCGLDTRAKIFGPGRVGRVKNGSSYDRLQTTSKEMVEEVVKSNQRKRERGEPGEGLGGSEFGSRAVISIGGRLISIPALIARVMGDTSTGSERARASILRALLSVTGSGERGEEEDDDDDDDDDDNDVDDDGDDDDNDDVDNDSDNNNNDDDDDDDNDENDDGNNSELLADDSEADEDSNDEMSESSIESESQDYRNDEATDDGALGDDEGEGGSDVIAIDAAIKHFRKIQDKTKE